MPQMKEGVDHTNMSPSLTQYYNTIDSIHSCVTGRSAIITSARDGKHMIGSLHYRGRAIDLRTRDLSPKKARRLTRELQTELGRLFDIVVEYDHIHLEYQPR